MYIYPYKAGSASVKGLKESLKDVKTIKLENSKFKGGEDKLVINWGNSKLPEEVMKATVLNNPESVEVASNKKKFFDAVNGKVSIPEYTDDSSVALSWLKDGSTVVVREKLQGHSGDGIIIIEDEDEWDNYKHDKAKIYVKYVKKKDEYRVHVVCGYVVDVQRKAVKPDTPKNLLNWQVRNHKNGFIFVRNEVNPPNQVLEEATKAVETIGLDFGAVDVIWNSFREKAYVLEINTAPGLQGTTLENYTQVFEELQKIFKETKKKGIKKMTLSEQLAMKNLADLGVFPKGGFYAPPPKPMHNLEEDEAQDFEEPLFPDNEEF